MALSTTFNRLKREIGIKKCVIIDGNVGDVYLNEKKQIVDLKQYLMDMLKSMNYDDVLYWDRVDGVDGDVSRLTVTDEVEVEGEAYSLMMTKIIITKKKRQVVDYLKLLRKSLILSLRILKSLTVRLFSY